MIGTLGTLVPYQNRNPVELPAGLLSLLDQPSPVTVQARRISGMG